MDGESIPAEPPVAPDVAADGGVSGFSWFPFVILLIGIIAVWYMKNNCEKGETIKKWRRNTSGRMSSRESEYNVENKKAS